MLSPLLCMFVPVAVITTGGYFGLAENVLMSYIALLALSLFPTTDAVLTIVFVTPYRRFTPSPPSGCGQSAADRAEPQQRPVNGWQ